MLCEEASELGAGLLEWVGILDLAEAHERVEELCMTQPIVSERWHSLPPPAGRPATGEGELDVARHELDSV